MAEPEENLTLAVPDSVGAFYAVPTTIGTVDTTSLVASALGQVEDSLPQPLPQPLIQIHPVDGLPPLPTDRMAASSASDEQLDRLRSATHLVLVSVGGQPGWPPAHEWIARTLAVGAATRLDSDVVDLLVHQILEPAAARATLPDPSGLACLADWISVGCWPDRAGYTCTTTGLRRFGLPELQTLATPPNLVDAWGQAMVGLAGQLLANWRAAIAAAPTAAFVSLRPWLALTDSDVIDAHAHTADGYGPRLRAEGPQATTVRLALDPGSDPHAGDSFLTINPPLRFAGSAGEHLAQACRDLFGPPPNEIRRAAPNPAMDEAIALARSGLTGIRRRFESGTLDARHRLLVKYALAADEATEYVWAYVTSWRDPFRILATSAADAVYQPRLRAGRPVVVDTAAVVDWAVEQDEAGIVEGAWTQGVLDEA